ncbi:Alpha/beta_hydrolase family protein [Hexamita inflata]|uniref:Alpha/beta hydrolase family protein n=1 Tax=Hexamita inflata TaxID=28002 RepID=A0AA86U6Z5_9EUKA|nr:Alpha/beta hydrolase family protein [Hexamita inflata]
MSGDEMIYEKSNIEHIPVEKFSLNPKSFHAIDFQGKKMNSYIDGPENGPKLFFIHGFNFFVEMYSTLINELIQTYRVLSVDLPGHGHTDAFEEYSVNTFQEAIMATLDHYDFKNFVLVGHSMGGQLSIMCTGDPRFAKFSISKTVAFCPSGIKVNISFGQWCLRSSFGRLFERFAFPDDLSKAFPLFPSQIKQSLFNVHFNVIKQNKKKYLTRQTKMCRTFPWECAKNEFQRAENERVLVVFASNDVCVDTQYCYQQIKGNLKWNVKVEKGLHELPIVRPVWAAQLIRDFE